MPHNADANAAFRASRIVGLALTLAGLWGCQLQSVDAPAESPMRLISVEEAASLPGVERAGFDVDDTLLFSTPAFARGFASGHEFGREAFWRVVNTSDADHSVVKRATGHIVETYLEQGIEVYAITARSPEGGDGLRAFLSNALNIPASHVFFEPEQKTQRIQELKLDVYFGDSDSDITDAMEAGTRAIRIQRSPESSYRNPDGTLRKYHPGQFGEEIVDGTEN